MSTTEGTHARWRITSTVRSLERTLTGPQRPLEHLETARHARDSILDAIDLLAAAARREGATYADIGRALGITRQAARQAVAAVERDRRRRDEDKTWTCLCSHVSAEPGPRRVERHRIRRSATSHHH